MSHETQPNSVRQQLKDVMEQLQSKTLKESESKELLHRAQQLMHEYNQQLQAEADKLIEWNKVLESQIRNMR